MSCAEIANSLVADSESRVRKKQPGRLHLESVGGESETGSKRVTINPSDVGNCVVGMGSTRNGIQNQ